MHILKELFHIHQATGERVVTTQPMPAIKLLRAHALVPH